MVGYPGPNRHETAVERPTAATWARPTVACMKDEDSRLLAELLRVLGESEPWAKRASSGAGMETAPRSPMRGDDDRLHPYEYLMLPGIPSATPWTTSPACGRGWRARVVPMYAASRWSGQCWKTHARRYGCSSRRAGRAAGPPPAVRGHRHPQRRRGQGNNRAARPASQAGPDTGGPRYRGPAGIAEDSVSRGAGYKEMVQAAGGGTARQPTSPT